MPAPRSLVAAVVAAIGFSLASPAVAAEDVPTFADRADRDVEEADRTFAILFDPLAIAAGVYGGDVDFVLGRHVAVSVEGDLYALPSGTATAFGAGVLLYPSSAFHGLYLHPRALYARPLGEGIVHFDGATDTVGLGGSAGWQWTWDYGLTARLGGGAMYFLGGAGPTSSPAPTGPQLILDGAVGWAF